VRNQGVSFYRKLSQEAEQYEYDAWIDDAPFDLHRQVDPPDFVFPQGAALPTRAAPPGIGKYFATNAHKDSAQSRIRGLNRAERDAIENYCCRVFVDSTGKDDDRASRRYVPMGKTTRQEGERWSEGSPS
jgi:hypothetical protein